MWYWQQFLKLVSGFGNLTTILFVGFRLKFTQVSHLQSLTRVFLLVFSRIHRIVFPIMIL